MGFPFPLFSLFFGYCSVYIDSWSCGGFSLYQWPSSITYRQTIHKLFPVGASHGQELTAVTVPFS